MSRTTIPGSLDSSARYGRIECPMPERTMDWIAELSFDRNT